jgi:hypothetical protein
MLKHISAAILLVFLVAACAQDIDIFIPDENPLPPDSNLVASGLSGIVLDEAALPVSDAFIQFGSSSTFSDANGVFFFREAEVVADGAQIRLEVPGYFSGLPVIYATEDGNFFLRVDLRPREVVATFPATEFMAIEAIEGLSLQMEENSLVDQQGEAYLGTVQVFSTVYDCTELEQFQQLPGNGRGLNLVEEEVALTPLVGFALEMEGDASDLLRAKEGSVVIPTVDIPVALQATAPSSLAVWHFDAESGYWNEVGTAIREGDSYTCEVAELGFLLLAEAYPFIEIEGVCLDDEGRPIGHEVLCMQLENGNYSAIGYTQLSGNYRFRIPANVAQDLHLLNDCGEALYTTLLGGLPSNTALPPIILDGGSGFDTWLNGTVTNCNEDPLAEGYLFVRQDNWVRPVVVDEAGNFQIHLSSCDADLFELQAFSFQNSETKGLATSHPYFAEMTFGNLNACEAIPASFSAFTLDTDNYYSSSLSAEPGGGTTLLTDGTGQLALQIPGESAGVYSLEPQDVTIAGFTAAQIAEADLIAVIDVFGGSGERISGSINGTFTDLEGNQHSVFGQFQATIP